MQSITCAHLKASSAVLFRRDLFGTQIKYLLPAFSPRGLLPLSTAAMSSDNAKVQIAATFQSQTDQEAFKEKFNLVSVPDLGMVNLHAATTTCNAESALALSDK